MQLYTSCNNGQSYQKYNSSLSEPLTATPNGPVWLCFPSSWSYCIHLLCLVLVLVLPVRARRPRDTQQQGQQAGLQQGGGADGEDVQQSDPNAATDNNCNKKDT